MSKLELRKQRIEAERRKERDHFGYLRANQIKSDTRINISTIPYTKFEG